MSFPTPMHEPASYSMPNPSVNAGSYSVPEPQIPPPSYAGNGIPNQGYPHTHSPSTSDKSSALCFAYFPLGMNATYQTQPEPKPQMVYAKTEDDEDEKKEKKGGGCCVPCALYVYRSLPPLLWSH